VTVTGIYIYEIKKKKKMDLTRFKTNSVLHSYEIRSKSDLFIADLNTKLFAQRIAYNSVLIYNSLSHEIKSITCVMKFKIIIFNFLLEKFLFCGRIDC
jgi:predicted metallopeptidase